MPLKERIITDLTTAMKAGDEIGKRTLRMLKAEVMKEEVAGPQRELADDEIVKIIKKLIKQRRDAAEQFEAGDRAAMAAGEREEIAVLEGYLPTQMGESEITAIVVAKKTALGITDKSKMGQLIGAVMKEVGDAADGGIVKTIVEKSF